MRTHSPVAPKASIPAPERHQLSQNDIEVTSRVSSKKRGPPTLRSGGLEFLRKYRVQGWKGEHGTKGRPKQGGPFFSTPLLWTSLPAFSPRILPKPTSGQLLVVVQFIREKRLLHLVLGHLTCEARQGPLKGEAQRLPLCKEEPTSGLTCGRAAHKSYSIVGRYWRKLSYTPVETFS